MPLLRHGKCSEVDSNALAKDCARLEDTRNNNLAKEKSSHKFFCTFLSASPCLWADWKPVGLVSTAGSRGGREKNKTTCAEYLLNFLIFFFVDGIRNQRMIQLKPCFLSRVLGIMLLSHFHSECTIIWIYFAQPAGNTDQEIWCQVKSNLWFDFLCSRILGILFSITQNKHPILLSFSFIID